MKTIHGGDVYRNNVILDFSVNVNPLGIPNTVIEALQQAVLECHTYPDIHTEALKEAVSSWLCIPKESLLFGNGASELFMGIVYAIRPKKVLVAAPSFYGYLHAAKAVDAEIQYAYFQKEQDFIPGEAFLQALTDDIDMVFFTNPNNPTGKLVSRAYMRKMIRICEEKNIYLVLDECFMEFCMEDHSMMREIKDKDHVLIVRAFTKIFTIPGVRLGYMICSDPALLEAVQKQLPEWNVSTFAQKAGIACTKLDAYVQQTKEYIREQRIVLTQQLRALGVQVLDSETNFLLIYSERPLYEALLKKGILIRNCENFMGLEKGYYRVAVRTKQENEQLWKAIGACIEEDRTFAAK